MQITDFSIFPSGGTSGIEDEQLAAEITELMDQHYDDLEGFENQEYIGNIQISNGETIMLVSDGGDWERPLIYPVLLRVHEGRLRYWSYKPTHRAFAPLFTALCDLYLEEDPGKEFTRATLNRLVVGMMLGYGTWELMDYMPPTVAEIEAEEPTA